ncbi:MAG: hemerythrin family protein [Terracidiphilus sp.]
MNGLAWTHACMVGVKAMDDQHGILVDTLNELRQQIARGNANSELKRQMERLVEFTRLHFGCEESLLERYDFPGLPEHRAAHQRLLSQIDRAAERGENGETNAFQKHLGSLSEAYMEHIEGLDRQYGEWLNQRGVY